MTHTYLHVPRQQAHKPCISKNLRDFSPVPEVAQVTSLNPAAIGVTDAARLLTRLGAQPVTEAMLRADIAAGAPTNADGSLNLVRYAAWLVKQMARGEGVMGVGGD
jgi:hypothetical protein